MRQYVRYSDADAHSDPHMHSPTLPKIFGDATPLSQPQPPLLALPPEFLKLILPHFATRPPTQPSANIMKASMALGIESHSEDGFRALIVMYVQHAFAQTQDVL
jgi:hypothetical protein